MLQRKPFQLGALDALQHFPRREAVTGHANLDQIARQNQHAFRRLHQVVIELGMHAHRLVRGQGPRRGGPDHGEGWAVHAQRRGVFYFEGDVDRGRRFVFVFHFGFGQRGTAIDAPMHGLRALVQVTAFQNAAEGANDVGLDFEIHREVRVRPIAQHAETNEILLLAFDLRLCVVAAQRTELRRRDLLAMLLFHLVFDRQAVTIPARHIRRIEPGQGFTLDDNVFEHLVDRVADVNVAVRIRRAVVQNEFWPALGRLAYALINALFLPRFKHGGFAFGEIAAHGKWRVEKVECVFVISHE